MTSEIAKSIAEVPERFNHSDRFLRANCRAKW
jgi:hypothetical protein